MENTPLFGALTVAMQGNNGGHKPLVALSKVVYGCITSRRKHRNGAH